MMVFKKADLLSIQSIYSARREKEFLLHRLTQRRCFGKVSLSVPKRIINLYQNLENASEEGSG